jgi:DNA-binding transcriptional LysR family regulator
MGRLVRTGHPLERWMRSMGRLAGFPSSFRITTTVLHLAAATLAPDLAPTHVVEQMTTALGLAAAGLGVALGPEYALRWRAWPLVAPPRTTRRAARSVSTLSFATASRRGRCLLPRLIELLRDAVQ